MKDPSKHDRELIERYAGQAITLFSLDKAGLSALLEKEAFASHDFVAKFCFDLAESMVRERDRRYGLRR